jgi:hypothetical protein
MNDEQIEQIKQRITFLTDTKNRFESFTLPLASAVIIALVGREYIGNILYISLALGGFALGIYFEIKISRIKKEIKSLINQLYES